MSVRLCSRFWMLLIAVSTFAVRADAGETTEPPRSTQKDLQTTLTDRVIPYLQKYCGDCHGADEQMAGIAVHELKSMDQLLPEYKNWLKVYRMIDAGAMPPLSHTPFPEIQEQSEVAAFFRSALLEFDCSGINHPGRPTIRRLNRAEYNNTIRDLFGITIRPADSFPFDDVGEGFDNIGDVLSVPPLLMEKYLEAAELVAAEVIDLRDFSKPETHQFPASRLRSSLNNEPDGLGLITLYSEGAVSFGFRAPVNGTYRIRVNAAADQAGSEAARIGFQLNGKQFAESVTADDGKLAWYEHTTTLSAGELEIAIAFLNDFYDVNAADGRKDRNLAVRSVEVIGPAEGRSPQWHAVHERIVSARPSKRLSVREAAQKVFRPLLRQAFRRPLKDQEVIRYATLVHQQVTERGETYERGLSLAIQAMLVSPDFLFRREPDREGNFDSWPLNDFEVASRLSYFLWSSMPDDELLNLAEKKKLLNPDVLKRQVARMLRDPKSVALADNFASQWLNLRNLVDVRPNPDQFTNFSPELKSDMEQETRRLFQHVVQKNRPIDDLLFADYSLMNQRLAEHYGITGVKGDEFIEVSLQGKNRAGILTHASILTLTSNPGRTSPVKRGKWILENLLGQAPPPAPPAVPALEETAKASPNLSLREQMELHRKAPGCASCHRVMDPLGLGLENFDAIGQWRDKDQDKPIDATGELPSGEKFQGPMELLTVLHQRKAEFHRTLTEKMLIYAVGRGLDYYDKCAVDSILVSMKNNDATFSSLVEGIVSSPPFLRRSRDRDPKPPSSKANE